MKRIALVTKDVDYATRVRSMSLELDAEILGFEPIDDNERTAHDVLEANPSLVLLGPGFDRTRLTNLTTELASLDPTINAVWIAEDSALTWRHALRSGATDVISPEGTSTEFITLIREAHALERSAPASDDEPPQELGRIITIASPKGGSGKTMICSNIAATLASSAERGVVLVDLDLQFGDVALALGLRPEQSIVDFLQAEDDPEIAQTSLMNCRPGLHVVAAPPNPAEAEDVHPERVAKMLATLRAEFSYVVVDTGAGLDEMTLTAIEQASDVVLVSTCDIASVQSMRKLVIVLDQLDLTQHERWVVFNRADSKTGMSPAEMEEATGLTIDVRIPSHKSISKAVNEGSPLAMNQPRSKSGKALIATARLLHNGRPTERTERRK